MKRLTALPRSRRHPDALKLAIRRKRARHQSTAREFAELVIAVCHQLRREIKAS